MKNRTKISYWAMFVVPVLLLTASVGASETDEDSPKNIQVESRQLTDEQRQALALEREMSAKEDVANDEEAPSARSIFKSFYQLHYGAFHRPYAVAIDGSTVELEDGSIWSLTYFSDRISVLSWAARDSIVVEQYSYTGKEYKLFNQTLNQSVVATPILGPIYNGNKTHWVVKKDIFGTIELEDGSEWEPYLSSSVSQWLPNDTVVIGAYEFGSSYNTILININLLDYARVKLKWKK